jgi:hypothetical protein
MGLLYDYHVIWTLGFVKVTYGYVVMFKMFF